MKLLSEHNVSLRENSHAMTEICKLLRFVPFFISTIIRIFHWVRLACKPNLSLFLTIGRRDLIRLYN